MVRNEFMLMQVIDVKLRLRYDSTMCKISRNFPDAQMMLWCNGNTDVLQISAKEQDCLEGVISSVGELVPIQNLIRDKGTALTMVMDCICDGIPILNLAEEQGCFPIGMKMYSDGWEAVRLFAPNQSALRKYVSQLEPHGKVEILSTKVRSESGALRELGIAPVPFFGGLTEKQIEVLVSAFESGLLCVPAKSKMDIVAQQVGLSRSTYGEHLRKAIQTLVENSYPVLKLYAASYSSPSVKGDK